MSIYAKAMAEATKILFGNKKNPKKKEVEIKWNTQTTMDDWSWESVKGKQIGKGLFTKAYLGNDDMVYLVIMDDTDNSKELLAWMYMNQGEMPFIPVVKRMGYVDIRGFPYTVYQSPLYKAPLRKKDSPEEFAIMKALQDAKLDAQLEMPSDEYGRCDRGHDFLRRLISAAERRGAPKGVSKSYFSGVLTALRLLSHYVADYGGELYPEFPARNLATDGNGYLILLDVLFNLRSAKEKQGMGKCRGDWR